MSFSQSSGLLLRVRPAFSRLARALCQGSIAMLASVTLHATEPGDASWRDFQHALGQPALIAANAEHALANTAYRPLPTMDVAQIDADKFRLGFFLFHEGRLSSDDAIACVTCHAGPNSGVDGRRVSLGVNHAEGRMNALSVLNATFHFRLFWDGRSVSLEDQALEPILSELEMVNSEDAVLRMLQDDTLYAERFAVVYPDGVTLKNMTDAMAHFQRFNFIRGNSPFQRHLSGEAGQMSAQALRGWQLFDDIGCSSCHNGISMGGNSYQKLGAAVPYYGAGREADLHDEGVRGRSQREQDLHVFKVPGLLNVANTAPYFHDGSVARLDVAIAIMAEQQLGRTLAEEDIRDIAMFLRALSSSYMPMPVEISAAEPASTPAQAHSAVAVSHRSSYAAAGAAILPVSEALFREAQRVLSGEVAHFDFLQFQHLELIRYARALHHPPSEMDKSLRQRLVSSAEQLLQAVNALEWPIADFLRAQAMSSVFSAQREFPLNGEARELLKDSSGRLAEQEHAARQALQDIELLLREIERLVPALDA